MRRLFLCLFAGVTALAAAGVAVLRTAVERGEDGWMAAGAVAIGLAVAGVVLLARLVVVSERDRRPR